jgi:putative transcription antitermination factor YqgF
MENILAIDYGTERVGIARSYGTLAEPLVILDNSAQLFPQLQALIAEHDITQIVVGMSENTMAEQTQHFISLLKKMTSVPIETTDETLSSKTVHQKLHEKNKGKAQYKGHIDHYAAAEFLQEYLESQ